MLRRLQGPSVRAPHPEVATLVSSERRRMQVHETHLERENKAALWQVGLVHSLEQDNIYVMASRSGAQPRTRQRMCYVKSVWCTARKRQHTSVMSGPSGSQPRKRQHICVMVSRSGAQPRTRQTYMRYGKSVWCTASNKKTCVMSSRSDIQLGTRQCICFKSSRSDAQP